MICCDGKCSLGLQLRVERIPHGGPLKLSPNVAKLFLASIAASTVAGNCQQCTTAAVAEVRSLVRALNPEQRKYTRLIADSVSAHCA